MSNIFLLDKGVCNFHYFLSHCVLQDVRVNYCYTKFENGRCQAPKPQNITKKACCCTGMPGQGWGDPCEICPSKQEGAYASYHRDTYARKHSHTYVHYLMGFMNFHISCFQRHILSSAPTWDIKRGRINTQKVCVSVTLTLHCPRVMVESNSLDVHVFSATDIDECINDPCINGQCINTDGSFRCECPMGYSLDISGVRCEGQFANCFALSVFLPSSSFSVSVIPPHWITRQVDASLTLTRKMFMQLSLIQTPMSVTSAIPAVTAHAQMSSVALSVHVKRALSLGQWWHVKVCEIMSAFSPPSRSLCSPVLLLWLISFCSSSRHQRVRPESSTVRLPLR